MTRINVIPVQELTVKHLVSEYKEIMRLPGNLQTSLNRKSKAFSIKEIPSQYTLGTGHIKYFFNKFTFLKKRFELLVGEMKRRGYKPNFTDSSIFNVDEKWMGDYTPTDEAIRINRERISIRLQGVK